MLSKYQSYGPSNKRKVAATGSNHDKSEGVNYFIFFKFPSLDLNVKAAALIRLVIHAPHTSREAKKKHLFFRRKKVLFFY